MLDVSKLRPTKLENCIIENKSLKNLLTCDFKNTNILLRGRAGVGKTLICNIVKTKYPFVTINEDITTLSLKVPSISTTTNLSLLSPIFHKIVDIIPISKLALLKSLSLLAEDHKRWDKSLFCCINLHYPNINKILHCYLNEN